MKSGRAARDPRDKTGQTRMLAQGVDCVIGPGKFGFGQGRVDLAMTDLMQQHSRPALAATQPGDKVVQTLTDIRRDRTTAERTDRHIAHG